MEREQRIFAVTDLLAWFASGAMAQEPSRQIVDLVFNVESLAFSVEDLGAGVQGLQVRETATETWMELPADILFDVDKAHIRAAAEPALRRAAHLIRKGARDTVVIAGHRRQGLAGLRPQAFRATLGGGADVVCRTRRTEQRAFSGQGVRFDASGRAQHEAGRFRRPRRPPAESTS